MLVFICSRQCTCSMHKNKVKLLLFGKLWRVIAHISSNLNNQGVNRCLQLWSVRCTDANWAQIHSADRRLIWFIQMARSYMSFGRWCRDMPGVPRWLEHPGAKHPGIVFDQNLKLSYSPNAIVYCCWYQWRNRYGKCVKWYVLCHN